MKQITELNGLVRKTIEGTYGLFDQGEEIILMFDNDSFAVLTVLYWGEEDAGICLDEHPITPRLAVKAGLITEEQYACQKEQEHREWQANLVKNEKAELRRLMEKYPEEVI